MPLCTSVVTRGLSLNPFSFWKLYVWNCEFSRVSQHSRFEVTTKKVFSIFHSYKQAARKCLEKSSKAEIWTALMEPNKVWYEQVNPSEKIVSRFSSFTRVSHQ